MYKLDEWVLYDQFPNSLSERLKRPKKAVILEVLGEKQYIIWVDDPSIEVERRRRKVNEENLKPLN